MTITRQLHTGNDEVLYLWSSVGQSCWLIM